MSHTSAIVTPAQSAPLAASPARPGEPAARRATADEAGNTASRSTDRTVGRPAAKREARTADSVELSPAARQPEAGQSEARLSAPGRSAGASGTGADEAVRGDLVTRIRSLIADGRYDTDERLDAAANKLIGQLDVEA